MLIAICCGLSQPPTLPLRVGMLCAYSRWMNSEESKKDHQKQKLRTSKISEAGEWRKTRELKRLFSENNGSRDVSAVHDWPLI